MLARARFFLSSAMVQSRRLLLPTNGPNDHYKLDMGLLEAKFQIEQAHGQESNYNIFLNLKHVLMANKLAHEQSNCKALIATIKSFNINNSARHFAAKKAIELKNQMAVKLVSNCIDIKPQSTDGIDSDKIIFMHITGEFKKIVTEVVGNWYLKDNETYEIEKHVREIQIHIGNGIDEEQTEQSTQSKTPETVHNMDMQRESDDKELEKKVTQNQHMHSPNNKTCDTSNEHKINSSAINKKKKKNLFGVRSETKKKNKTPGKASTSQFPVDKTKNLQKKAQQGLANDNKRTAKIRAVKYKPPPQAHFFLKKNEECSPPITIKKDSLKTIIEGRKKDQTVAHEQMEKTPSAKIPEDPEANIFTPNNNLTKRLHTNSNMSTPAISIDCDSHIGKTPDFFKQDDEVTDKDRSDLGDEMQKVVDSLMNELSGNFTMQDGKCGDKVEETYMDAPNNDTQTLATEDHKVTKELKQKLKVTQEEEFSEICDTSNDIPINANTSNTSSQSSKPTPSQLHTPTKTSDADARTVISARGDRKRRRLTDKNCKQQ